jgi:hypothetical protein
MRGVIAPEQALLRDTDRAGGDTTSGRLPSHATTETPGEVCSVMPGGALCPPWDTPSLPWGEERSQGATGDKRQEERGLLRNESRADPCSPCGSQRWRGSVRKRDHIGSVPEMALSLWEPPQRTKGFARREDRQMLAVAVFSPQQRLLRRPVRSLDERTRRRCGRRR